MTVAVLFVLQEMNATASKRTLALRTAVSPTAAAAEPVKKLNDEE